MAWLAAAVFVVSAGYGALMPLLPAWRAPWMTADGQAEVVMLSIAGGKHRISRLTLTAEAAPDSPWRLAAVSGLNPFETRE